MEGQEEGRLEVCVWLEAGAGKQQMPDSVFPTNLVCRVPLLSHGLIKAPPLAAAASLQLYLQEGGFGVILGWFVLVYGCAEALGREGCSHTPPASVALYKTRTILILYSTMDKKPGFHRAFIYKYLQVFPPLYLKIETQP